MNKLITNNSKPIDTTIKFSVVFLITVLVLLLVSGCGKNSERAIKVVEGIVFEDCNGQVLKNEKILLQYISTGSWTSKIISEDSILTDNNGYYKFEYREAEDDGSSVSYYHYLSIPNSSIGISNPTGIFDLYPNDTLMNAIVNIKFKNRYTSNDTFYYQFKPSPKGYIEEPDKLMYLLGPFNDTTLVLKNLRIGSTNSETKGQGYCGLFKWGVGKRRFNSNATGHDGRFNLTHEPCFENDTFDYLTEPF